MKDVWRIQKEVGCSEKTVYNARRDLKKEKEKISKIYSDFDKITKVGLLMYGEFLKLVKLLDFDKDINFKVLRLFEDGRALLRRVRKDYELDNLEVQERKRKDEK